ncbi:MAG: 23S rRNA (uracil-5-)-methyltransferase RumA [Bacteroidetes bacterium GWF2_42_66]|nr:MAG: 23S rRNA (uracil-5-)-methyltransferase RumA [Bacteroidetes bacterium GWA2_42_15]OFY03253.1 MAG: 23S rRNA (uracil-5-)-methyltransferase RumA [Bacteroidetes bacterium GWE2_42_39]OFY45697.1 MAG: 23S rRNA (uracil-5-)-methyltransferase RumA [Bacteroidetes bacterium GWF2_42_66]HBL77314.1 23S rRNA (uracil(1939)-C(5))-methyltransferase RlmD [Prolixibacteraceae bacterium]HCR91943.1 23S rRNA (uracil(1939)-C(5))-methyltransferase RlmD [Prolixibacteraceae bacterium]
MGRSRQKKPLLENVRITDVGAEGKAIARVNDMVVFTTHVIPGDVVDIQVTNKRKNYMEGRVTAIREYSAERQDAFCQHFGVCGGCKWQFLPYERQLFYKQKQVADQLRRIGRVELPEINPILGSVKTTYYRNKLEFSFSNKRWLTEKEIGTDFGISDMNALGFHVPGLFDKIIDIEKCWLQDDPSNEIRDFIRSYALEHRLEFFDIKNIAGFLRNIIIRTATTGDLMVIVSMFREDKKEREQLLEALAVQFPQISSLMYVINPKRNDTLTDQDILVYRGNDHIFEKMEGLRFKIGPKSFYQTNSEQAYELYKVAREFAGLTGSETVYDLYTGTGTIANFIASKARKVIGIEYVPEAIDDARVNAALNGIDNAVFFAGDMKDLLTRDFIAQNGQPDVIITDPPRAGMHEDVVRTILNTGAKRIVYVSCNPATQARDIQLLSENYTVTRIQPVDMFPHTHHVENVVLMEQIERIRPGAS